MQLIENIVTKIGRIRSYLYYRSCVLLFNRKCLRYLSLVLKRIPSRLHFGSVCIMVFFLSSNRLFRLSYLYLLYSFIANTNYVNYKVILNKTTFTFTEVYPNDNSRSYARYLYAFQLHKDFSFPIYRTELERLQFFEYQNFALTKINILTDCAFNQS